MERTTQAQTTAEERPSPGGATKLIRKVLKTKSQRADSNC